MSEVTLHWDRPMTSIQAARYLLTSGFVAEELYRATAKRVAELEAELASRRAADEGVVTVEGYADLRVFNGSPWNTLRGAANMMRVFMEGIDGKPLVNVTLDIYEFPVQQQEDGDKFGGDVQDRHLPAVGKVRARMCHGCEAASKKFKDAAERRAHNARRLRTALGERKIPFAAFILDVPHSTLQGWLTGGLGDEQLKKCLEKLGGVVA